MPIDNLTDTDGVSDKISEIFKLRFKNKLSYQEIANRLNLPKSSVHARLTSLLKLLPNAEELETYNANKEYFLESAEYKLLGKMLDDTAIKDASLNNAAYAFTQAFNANRLTKGLTTQAISYQDTTEEYNRLRAEREQLERIIDTPCKVSTGQVGTDVDNKGVSGETENGL